MKKGLNISLLALGFGLLLFAACKREDPLPKNPYDDVVYDPSPYNDYVPNPDGITGIYEYILRQKCNLPGCHDGHFEPDFRSIQSTWSTLVYAKVMKNTADSAYTYRVTPRDTAASIFWHRVQRGDAQLQRMPATGQYLTASELEHVRNWIMDGARDMFGNLPVLPNGEPRILGFVAFNQAFTTQLDVTENRLDSVPYHPFIVPTNTTFNVVMLVQDDSTAVNQLQVNRLKLSLQKNNFTAASSVNAYFLGSGFNVWVCPVNSGSFAAGDTVYMRYYVNDGHQPQNTEFPRDDNEDAYKTYASFFVKP
jgi:hypothetical protein